MDALLEELCVKYGWCLTQKDRAALVDEERHEREAIIDAIIRTEFGEPRAGDPNTRSWLAALVDDWLFDPTGRGAFSGLPD